MPRLADIEVAITAETSNFDAAMSSADKKVNDFGNQSVGVGTAAAGVEGQTQQMSALTQETERATMASRDFNAASLAMGGAALGIAAGLADSTMKAGEFQASMNEIGSVTGATASELEALSAMALKVGMDTAFSAQEGAAAITELGKAGVPIPDILDGAAMATANLAAAGGVDMPRAAEVMSNAMNVFKIAGSDSADVADTLAAAANTSAASIDSIAMGMAQAGPAAAGLGLSLEETSAAIALFADRGMQGSDAGTSLKTMLASLTPSTKPAREAFVELGLATIEMNEAGEAVVNSKFFDDQGNFVGMAKASDELYEALKDLTDEQRAMALETIFGSDASRAAELTFQAQKNAVEGTGRGYQSYLDAVQPAGQATDVANAKMAGMKGAMDALGGSIETAQIVIGMAFVPAVEKAADILSMLVNVFLGLSPEIQTFIAIGAAAAAGFLAIGSAVGFLVGPLGATISAMAPLASGLLAVLGPIALVVAAIGALYVAYKTNFLGFADGVNAAVAKVQETFTNLKDFFENTLVPAFEEGGIVGALGAIKDGLIGTFQSIDWAAIGQSALDGIGNLANAFNSINWQGISDAIMGALNTASDTLFGWFNTLGASFEAWASTIDWSGVALSIVQGIGNALALYVDVYAWLFSKFGDFGVAAATWVGSGLASLKTAWGSLWSDGTGGGDGSFAQSLIDGLGDLTAPAKEWIGKVQTALTPAWEEIKSGASTAWEEVRTEISSKWDDIKIEVASKLDDIKAEMPGKVSDIQAAIATGWEAIKSEAEQKFGEMMSLIGEKWNEIKADAESHLDEIKPVIAEKWESIKEESGTKFDDMKSLLSEKWEAIKEEAGTKLDDLKAVAAEKWDALKAEAGTKFEEMKTILGEKWTAIKDDMVAKLDDFRSVANEKWEALKNEAGTKFDDLKTLLGEKWEAIKTDASSKIDELKTAIASKWDELKTEAESKFGELQTAIVAKLAELQTAIVAEATKIKDAFILELGKIATEAATKIEEVKTAIQTAFANAGEWLRAAGGALVGGFIQGITDRMPDLLGQIESMGNTLGAAINDLGIDGNFGGINAGGNISQGVADGITSGQGNVETAAAGLGTAAIGAINDATLSESPSKLAYMSGEFVVQGFGSALTDGATTMPAYVQPMIDALVLAFNGFLNDLRELFGIAVIEVGTMSDSIFTAIDGDVTAAVQRVRDLQEEIRGGDFSINVTGSVSNNDSTNVSNDPGFTSTNSRADRRAARRAARQAERDGERAPTSGSASGNASYAVDAGHQSQHTSVTHTSEPATVTYYQTTVVLRDERDMQNYVAQEQRAERRSKGRGGK